MNLRIGYRKDLPDDQGERFMLKVKVDDSGCWLWQGSVNGKGRPTVYDKDIRNSHYAHRLAYQLFVGEFDESLYVCHTCDTPMCVNPKHLFLGTQADNMADMVRKDRANKPKGSRNGRAKLTEDDVRFIRKHYVNRHPEFGQKALSARYGVTTMTIQEVINFKKWTHVT